jgi:hypothetical protein
MEVIDLIEERDDVPHLPGTATTGRQTPEDADQTEQYK